jgi:hypothetical protein
LPKKRESAKSRKARRQDWSCAGEKDHPRSRNDNGYVITAGGKRLYIAGGTEDIPEARALKGIDLPYTMTPKQVADLVLDVAGVPVPRSVRGRSVLPLWKGEAGGQREHLHTECAPLFHALTDGRTTYVWFASDGNRTALPPSGPLADRHTKLVRDLAERERNRAAT